MPRFSRTRAVPVFSAPPCSESSEFLAYPHLCVVERLGDPARLCRHEGAREGEENHRRTRNEREHDPRREGKHREPEERRLHPERLVFLLPIEGPEAFAGFVLLESFPRGLHVSERFHRFSSVGRAKAL